MADAISTLPPRVRNFPSVQGLASSLDRSKKMNATLREKAKGPGLFAVLIPTQTAAFMAGFVDSKAPDFAQGRVAPSAIVGAGLLAFGIMRGSPASLYAGSMLLGIQSYAMGARAGGASLTLTERDEPAQKPVPLSVAN